MKRIKYGSGKTMTPEQKKEHLKQLRKEWRKRHPEKIKAMNHKWGVYYAHIKPCKCICRLCGKEFGAARKYFVTCPECIKKRIDHAKKIRYEKMQRKAERELRNKKILLWHSKGWYQEEIGQKLGVSQGTVSYVLRTNGIITQIKKKKSIKNETV